MTKQTATKSILLAGLLAAAGFANAQYYTGGPIIKPISSAAAVRADAKNQDRASASANLPNRAGEASTMTQGAPNLVTSNPASSELHEGSAMAVRNDAKNQDTASATSGVPNKAGEASAIVNGVPNMDPAAPGTNKRAGVFAARRLRSTQSMGAPASDFQMKMGTTPADSTEMPQ